MICQKCKQRQATVLYKETINGVTDERALCAQCAQELSLGGLFGEDFNLFAGLFDKKPTRTPEAKVCDLCGSTFEQIAREGKVGCARCYEVFKESLRPSIERIHGNSRHVGAKPKDAQERDKKADELGKLKKELAEAIACENFEQAAVLRDKIKEMEG